MASYVPQAQESTPLVGLYISRNLQQQRLRSSTSILTMNVVLLTIWLHSDVTKRHTVSKEGGFDPLTLDAPLARNIKIRKTV